MPENETDTTSSRPLIAVETDPSRIAVSRADGVAVHTSDGGVADCEKRGVAYCENSGTATSFDGGVAYVRTGGSANTGDGGVSVAKGACPEASCEGWGVAFVRSESYAERGKVKGGRNSVLIISWNDPTFPNTPVRSVQVGGTDSHSLEILPGAWYTLDAADSTRWVKLPPN